MAENNTNLTEIKAPTLTDSSFGQSIAEQFKNINDNFQKLARLDVNVGKAGKSCIYVNINLLAPFVYPTSDVNSSSSDDFGNYQLWEALLKETKFPQLNTLVEDLNNDLKVFAELYNLEEDNAKVLYAQIASMLLWGTSTANDALPLDKDGYPIISPKSITGALHAKYGDRDGLVQCADNGAYPFDLFGNWMYYYRTIDPSTDENREYRKDLLVGHFEFVTPGKVVMAVSPNEDGTYSPAGSLAYWFLDPRFRNGGSIQDPNNMQDVPGKDNYKSESDVQDISCMLQWRPSNILEVADNEIDKWEGSFEILNVFPTLIRVEGEYYWAINGKNTGIKARGDAGTAGSNGQQLVIVERIENVEGFIPGESGATIEKNGTAYPPLSQSQLNDLKAFPGRSSRNLSYRTLTEADKPGYTPFIETGDDAIETASGKVSPTTGPNGTVTYGIDTETPGWLPDNAAHMFFPNEIGHLFRVFRIVGGKKFWVPVNEDGTTIDEGSLDLSKDVLMRIGDPSCDEYYGVTSGPTAETNAIEMINSLDGCPAIVLPGPAFQPDQSRTTFWLTYLRKVDSGYKFDGDVDSRPMLVAYCSAEDQVTISIDDHSFAGMMMRLDTYSYKTPDNRHKPRGLMLPIGSAQVDNTTGEDDEPNNSFSAHIIYSDLGGFVGGNCPEPGTNARDILGAQTQSKDPQFREVINKKVLHIGSIEDYTTLDNVEVGINGAIPGLENRDQVLDSELHIDEPTTITRYRDKKVDQKLLLKVEGDTIIGPTRHVNEYVGKDWDESDRQQGGLIIGSTIAGDYNYGNENGWTSFSKPISGTAVELAYPGPSDEQLLFLNVSDKSVSNTEAKYKNKFSLLAIDTIGSRLVVSEDGFAVRSESETVFSVDKSGNIQTMGTEVRSNADDTSWFFHTQWLGVTNNALLFGTQHDNTIGLKYTGGDFDYTPTGAVSKLGFYHRETGWTNNLYFGRPTILDLYASNTVVNGALNVLGKDPVTYKLGDYTGIFGLSVANGATIGNSSLVHQHDSAPAESANVLRKDGNSLSFDVSTYMLGGMVATDGYFSDNVSVKYTIQADKFVRKNNHPYSLLFDSGYSSHQAPSVPATVDDMDKWSSDNKQKSPIILDIGKAYGKNRLIKFGYAKDVQLKEGDSNDLNITPGDVDHGITLFGKWPKDDVTVKYSYADNFYGSPSLGTRKSLPSKIWWRPIFDEAKSNWHTSNTANPTCLRASWDSKYVIVDLYIACMRYSGQGEYICNGVYGFGSFSKNTGYLVNCDGDGLEANIKLPEGCPAPSYAVTSTHFGSWGAEFVKKDDAGSRSRNRFGNFTQASAKPSLTISILKTGYISVTSYCVPSALFLNAAKPACAHFQFVWQRTPDDKLVGGTGLIEGAPNFEGSTEESQETTETPDVKESLLWESTTCSYTDVQSSINNADGVYNWLKEILIDQTGSDVTNGEKVTCAADYGQYTIEKINNTTGRCSMIVSAYAEKNADGSYILSHRTIDFDYKIDNGNISISNFNSVLLEKIKTQSGYYYSFDSDKGGDFIGVTMPAKVNINLILGQDSSKPNYLNYYDGADWRNIARAAKLGDNKYLVLSNSTEYATMWNGGASGYPHGFIKYVDASGNDQVTYFDKIFESAKNQWSRYVDSSWTDYEKNYYYVQRWIATYVKENSAPSDSTGYSYAWVMEYRKDNDLVNNQYRPYAYEEYRLDTGQITLGVDNFDISPTVIRTSGSIIVDHFASGLFGAALDGLSKDELKFLGTDGHPGIQCYTGGYPKLKDLSVDSDRNMTIKLKTKLDGTSSGGAVSIYVSGWELYLSYMFWKLLGNNKAIWRPETGFDKTEGWNGTSIMGGAGEILTINLEDAIIGNPVDFSRASSSNYTPNDKGFGLGFKCIVRLAIPSGTGYKRYVIRAQIYGPIWGLTTAKNNANSRDNRYICMYMTNTPEANLYNNAKFLPRVVVTSVETDNP